MLEHYTPGWSIVRVMDMYVCNGGTCREIPGLQSIGKHWLSAIACAASCCSDSVSTQLITNSLSICNHLWGYTASSEVRSCSASLLLSKLVWLVEKNETWVCSNSEKLILWWEIYRWALFYVTRYSLCKYEFGASMSISLPEQWHWAQCGSLCYTLNRLTHLSVFWL